MARQLYTAEAAQFLEEEQLVATQVAQSLEEEQTPTEVVHGPEEVAQSLEGEQTPAEVAPGLDQEQILAAQAWLLTELDLALEIISFHT